MDGGDRGWRERDEEERGKEATMGTEGTEWDGERGMEGEGRRGWEDGGDGGMEGTAVADSDRKESERPVLS